MIEGVIPVDAEIISVGTELLLGDIVNTNAQFLSKELASLGISVKHISMVGDNFERIIELVKNSLKRCDIIITTGGLGPTEDDLTKEACCEALGVPLVLDDDSLRSIECYFQKKGSVMAESNRKQAYLPEGCTIFHNANGTAPGCAVCKEGKHLILLPGPPKELQPMFVSSVLPYLEQYREGVIFSQNIHISGIGESSVAEMAADLLAMSNPTVAPYAAVGDVRLRVTAKAADLEKAKALCAPVVEEIKKRFGNAVYGVDCESLQQEVVRLLSVQKKTVATAESCTGGLIAKRITDLSGSSAVFECGIVSYSNRIKQALLGVSAKTLHDFGAVSEQTAREMAEGALRVSGASLAVSSTGIAGPTGGTLEKPVGLAYIALTDGEKQIVRKVCASAEGNRRDYNRQITATAALKLLYDYLAGHID